MPYSLIAAIAPPLITTGLNVSKDLLHDRKNEKLASLEHESTEKLALIQQQSEQQQAKRELVRHTTTAVLGLTGELVKAYHIKTQSKLAMEQAAVARDNMQHNADLAKQQMNNAHEHNMHQLDTSHDAFKTAVQAMVEQSQNVANTIQHDEAYKKELMAAVTRPNISIEERQTYVKLLQDLPAAQIQQANISKDILTAFVHSTDANRQAPKTYTDIGSYSKSYVSNTGIEDN